MKTMTRVASASLLVMLFLIWSEPAEAGSTQNRQLFTLCTLGLPGSEGASDCERIWNECASNGKKWRKRNCRISFYPSAHDQAQQLIEQTIQQELEKREAQN